MKKLLFSIVLILFVVTVFGQVTNRNIMINKTTPALYLNGTGAIIDFYNNDLRITHSSNTLTLSGGNLALGANNLTLTGSIAATGARATKGWFTDLEVTNLPTVNGGTLKTALSLTSTDVGLGNVTNESKSTMFTNPTFTGVQKVSTTDTLATKAYARSVGGGIGGGTVNAYSDTMSVSAGVLRTKATTITTEPYSVQIFSSGGKDITHAVSDSVALNGGVYKLYVYSVDALSGCKLKILY